MANLFRGDESYIEVISSPFNAMTSLRLFHVIWWIWLKWYPFPSYTQLFIYMYSYITSLNLSQIIQMDIFYMH